jgi:hypothetical protein
MSNNINFNNVKAASNGYVTSAQYNQLVDIVRSTIICDSKDLRIHRHPGGTRLNVNFPHYSNNTTVVTDFNPFQVVSFTPVSSGSSTYNATLYPGMINGTIFPQVNGTYMWQFVETTDSEGHTVYIRPTLTVSKGDTIYIQADIAAGQMTDANIYSNSSVPSETDSVAIYKIATVDSSTGAVSQLLTHNLGYVAQAAYFDAGSRLIYHLWFAQ